MIIIWHEREIWLVENSTDQIVFYFKSNDDLINQVAFLSHYHWVCILFKNSGELHTFDVSKGGELVTAYKRKNGFNMTAIDTLRGKVLCSGT
jgi:hypothetical protein